MTRDELIFKAEPDKRLVLLERNDTIKAGDFVEWPERSGNYVKIEAGAHYVGQFVWISTIYRIKGKNE